MLFSPQHAAETCIQQQHSLHLLPGVGRWCCRSSNCGPHCRSIPVPHDRLACHLPYSFRIRHSQAKCILVAHVGVCVSLSAPRRMTTLLHVPGCNLGNGIGGAPYCALLGGFAIGARVWLLWQHTSMYNINMLTVRS